MAQLHHSTLYIVIQRSLQVVHWCRLVVELFVFLLKKIPSINSTTLIPTGCIFNDIVKNLKDNNPSMKQLFQN